VLGAVGIAFHYLRYGQRKPKFKVEATMSDTTSHAFLRHGPPSDRVQRFTWVERIMHWFTAAVYIYAGLSGLACSRPTFIGSPLSWVEGRRSAPGTLSSGLPSSSEFSGCTMCGRGT